MRLRNKFYRMVFIIYLPRVLRVILLMESYYYAKLQERSSFGSISIEELPFFERKLYCYLLQVLQFS